MRQNAGLLSQHVSSTSMPIFRGTIVSSAFRCPIRAAGWGVLRGGVGCGYWGVVGWSAVCFTVEVASRFGHQKAELTVVLLKIVILVFETC
jgi:hypothetical protein